MRSLFGKLKPPQLLLPTPVHPSGTGQEPLNSKHQGDYVLLLARITYPGSTITDLLIGNHKVQVTNASLRLAHKMADNVLYREEE
jgi:hypothetical protein